MRLPWRKNKTNGDNLLEVKITSEIISLINSYANMKGVTKEEALIELARKGYDHWLLERKYGDASNKLGWDPLERYRIALHAYLNAKLRLREMYQDLQRLVLLLSSLIRELKDCNTILEREGKQALIKAEELSLYDEALSDYMEKYVNKVGVEAKETGGLQEFLEDCEKILEKFKKELGDNEKNNS